MTDEQIIKALECCEYKSTCKECPYYQQGASCLDVEVDALDLINRQKAEIERLKIDVPRFYAVNEVDPSLADLLRNSKPTICLLTDDSSIEIIPNKETIRAEAIKDFAERLKKRLDRKYKTYGRQYVLWHLRELVKEMIGEQE